MRTLGNKCNKCFEKYWLHQKYCNLNFHLEQMHSWTESYLISKLNFAFYRNGGQKCDITGRHQVSNDLLECPAEHFHFAYLIHHDHRRPTSIILDTHHQHTSQHQQQMK